MRKIILLCADADRRQIEPVLGQLQAKGFRIGEGNAADKKTPVLAVLSETFYADREQTQRLLALVGAGAETILPVQIDGAEIPDVLKNALYARNIISVSGRDAEHVAERIEAAMPKKKSPLMRILVAGGILLTVFAGIFIRQRLQPAEPAAEAESEAAAEPEEEKISVIYPGGITEEDLAEIRSIVIIGDMVEFQTIEDLRQNSFREETQDTFAYASWEEDGCHWYSREDGHEYSLTHYEDLSFIGRMPNLGSLSLVYAETEDANWPDLSACRSLKRVYAADCTFPDLEWMRGSLFEDVSISRSRVTDFSPLTDCGNLKYAEFRLENQNTADFSDFRPASLVRLQIADGEGLSDIRLDGLSACGKLEELDLRVLPVRDIAFLAGTGSLQILRMEQLRELRDISALADLKNLERLQIEYCGDIADYSPIAGCTGLETVLFHCDENPDAMTDASFLSDLPKLREIHLYSCNLRNMDFLEEISRYRSSLSLAFAGEIGDYSGLSRIDHYEYLHVNPRGQDNPRGGDFSAVLPYLADAKIDELVLYSCRGTELSALPDGIRRLTFERGDLENLSGLRPYDLESLGLLDCQYLTSLEGIENIPSFFDRHSFSDLRICGCPRLADYSALSGAGLKMLNLTGAYVLPDLGSLAVKGLRLESIEDLEDLHVLDALSDSSPYDTIELVGLDQVSDLSPLRRFSIGSLTVPPHLAEQAEELAEDGIAGSFEAAYPDGRWEPMNSRIELLDLAELDTLPGSLLRHIEKADIAGDRIFDWTYYDIREDWENEEDGRPALLLHNRETGEDEPLGNGPVTDLSVFSGLTGIRELRLRGQPLQSIDGIQMFSDLEYFEAEYCYGLTDASPAFAVQGLRSLILRRTGITSIQGVQNLKELRELSVSGTGVSDLTPLGECDFSAACGEEGFELGLGDTPVEDFSPLAAIRVYRGLDLNGHDPSLWMDAAADSDIRGLQCGFSTCTDGQLAEIAGQHPELEELSISQCENVTDLTPLLKLENLRRVRVSGSMEQALASLEGQEYGFELEIE